VRKATFDDIPALLDMFKKFHAVSGQPMAFNREATADFVASLIGSASGAAIVSDTGMIGGVLAPAYCDPDWMMAIELFWWAERDGMALLRAFEDWGREVGAQEVRMTSLSELPRADAILRRKGYDPAEVSYSRVL